MKYKIGQILTLNQEVVEVEGYDNSGIAEYIYIYLRPHLPSDGWMKDYEIPKNKIIEEIEYALDEIGMCVLMEYLKKCRKGAKNEDLTKKLFENEKA